MHGYWLYIINPTRYVNKFIFLTYFRFIVSISALPKLVSPVLRFLWTANAYPSILKSPVGTRSDKKGGNVGICRWFMSNSSGLVVNCIAWQFNAWPNQEGKLWVPLYFDATFFQNIGFWKMCAILCLKFWRQKNPAKVIVFSGSWACKIKSTGELDFWEYCYLYWLR